MQHYAVAMLRKRQMLFGAGRHVEDYSYPVDMWEIFVLTIKTTRLQKSRLTEDQI